MSRRPAAGECILRCMQRTQVRAEGDRILLVSSGATPRRAQLTTLWAEIYPSGGMAVGWEHQTQNAGSERPCVSTGSVSLPREEARKWAEAILRALSQP